MINTYCSVHSPSFNAAVIMSRDITGCKYRIGGYYIDMNISNMIVYKVIFNV